MNVCPLLLCGELGSRSVAHRGRRNQRDHDGEEPESCVISHDLIYLFKRGLWSRLCQTLTMISIFILDSDWISFNLAV
jgi:hypothetical protein